MVPARGPSSVLTTVPSGSVTGDDLAREEAAVDGLLGAVLAAHAPVVLVLAADAGEQRDVLGGLAHRDVDVGDAAVLARVVPLVGAGRGAAPMRSCGLGEQRVLAVRASRRQCPSANRDTVSTPAEMNASPSPALIAWNAIRVVCSDDEQYRFTVVPGRKS